MFNPIGLILPTLIFVCLMLLVRRAIIASKSIEKQSHAKAASSGCSVSQWTEFCLLLCIGGLIYLFTATNTSTGGRLLVLDKLNPSFARVNLYVAIVVGICFLLSLGVVLLKKTEIAMYLAATTMIIYAILLNGPGELMEQMTGEDGTKRQVTWTINTSGADVEGAELWVNNVRLGSFPYTTTPEEFKALVPFWEEAPAEMENDQDRLHTQRFSPWSEGTSFSWRQWNKIVMPGKEAYEWGMHSRASKASEKARTYYARIKWQGEWAYCRGASSGGSGGKHQYHQSTSISQIRFPQREQRMEQLLDQARLAHYRPTESWFQAFATYGDDAVVALREQAVHEPNMGGLLSQWASYHYQLDKVHDTSTAWQAFQQICDEADQTESYSTASLAGQAVELLVPYLDPQQLSQKAIAIIKSDKRYSWSQWTFAGTQHFGFSTSPKGLRTGSQHSHQYWRSDRHEQLPIHAYAVAHAIWKKDEWLDENISQQENVIEKEVIPVFLAYNYFEIQLLRWAVPIGSEALDTYLWRQNWRTNGSQLPYRYRYDHSGADLNGWCYLLSKLKSPTGDRFRKTHTRRITEMADKLMKSTPHDTIDALSFLFSDLDRGQESLAHQYWPRFQQLSQRDKHDCVDMQYLYLVTMEPVSTVGMYMDVYWNAPPDEHNLVHAWRHLSHLPEAKQQAIFENLKEAIEQDVTHLTRPSSEEKHVRDYLLRELNNTSPPIMKSKIVLQEFQNQSSRHMPHRVQGWLALEKKEHPLIPLLIQEPNPDLRQLVLDALEAHPTPQHQKLLHQLTQDESDTIRTKAQTIAQYHKNLSAIPPHQLRSIPQE